jgi:hypothetical protein
VGSDAMSNVCLRYGCAAFAASAHGSEVGESGFTWHDVSLLFCAWIVTKKKISVATIALKYWFSTQSINGAAVGRD